MHGQMKNFPPTILHLELGQLQNKILMTSSRSDTDVIRHNHVKISHSYKILNPFWDQSSVSSTSSSILVCTMSDIKEEGFAVRLQISS